MPVRSNGYFNNPAFAQAAANLGSLFEAPSGADAAAWAAANATREKAGRLATLFANPTDPNFDRLNIAAGNYTPVQSYYAQDQNNATARYGVDTVAATSLSNNAADNSRALQTNSADNVRALDDRRLQEAAAMQRLGVTDATARYGVDTVARTALNTNAADNTRALATNGADNQRALIEAAMGAATAPVAQGAIRPGFDPAQYGVNAPAVPQFAGRTAPLNEAEQKAIERQKLIEGGQLTNEMLVNTIVGDQAPVQAVGPDGVTPRYMSPGEAARTGAQPYVNPGSQAKADVQNYVAPDGTQGTAVFDGRVMRNTQTGAAIPEGSQLFKAQTGGSAVDALNTKTTEAQDKNAYAATMAEGPTKTVLDAFDRNELPSNMDFKIQQALESTPTAIAPELVKQMSPQGQIFFQGVRSALPFQLMSQSGQAVTEQEYNRKMLELVPVPGEDPAVTQSKRQQFETYIKAARGIAGPAYDKIHMRGQIPTPATTAPAPAAPATAPAARMKFDADGNLVQ